jgi:hypothetical protein
MENRLADTASSPARRSPDVAVSVKHKRARLTNKPLRVRANRHTAQGRRLCDLFEGYVAALGNPTDPLVLANVLAASELKTVAEVMRSKLLAGESIDPAHVVKVENLANRAERKLGLDQRKREQAPAPLRERLVAARGSA